jgi:hypothetical protein
LDDRYDAFESFGFIFRVVRFKYQESVRLQQMPAFVEVFFKGVPGFTIVCRVIGQREHNVYGVILGKVLE